MEIYYYIIILRIIIVFKNVITISMYMELINILLINKKNVVQVVCRAMMR